MIFYALLAGFFVCFFIWIGTVIGLIYFALNWRKFLLCTEDLSDDLRKLDEKLWADLDN